MRYNDGYLIGTGSARNVELGFIPSFVRVMNLTGTINVTQAALGEVIGFDGGGTKEIRAGDAIYASDKGWEGIVQQVILNTGSWAGGNATGFIVFVPGTLTGAGNIADNDVIRIRPQDGVDDTATNRADVVTAGVRNGTFRTVAATALAAGGSNQDIVAYQGADAAGAKGFTIQSAVLADGDLGFYQAWSPDPGSGPIDLAAG